MLCSFTWKATNVASGVVGISKTSIYTSPSSGFATLKIFTVQQIPITVIVDSTLIADGVLIGKNAICNQDTSLTQYELPVNIGSKVYVYSNQAKAGIWKILN